ncbi:MAG: hypothetical protein MI743_08860 [Sneathiellales bacterium]|nr:hypothetical protein [Sneathiellales bacterium]
MSDTPSSGSEAGAPTVAGKLVIPDMTPMSTAQKNNVEVVSAINTEMSKAIQDIVSGQQATLKQVLDQLQNAVKNDLTAAGYDPSKAPNLSVSLDNLQTVTNCFNEAAQKLTAATTQSDSLLTQSVNKSMAKIEEVATKFSGG